MHHLEFIQNCHHSIVFISMGIIPTTVTVASETPHATWKAAHDGTFCSSWLYIRANIQAWFERFYMAWHPFPMSHISDSTQLVMIGFGLAPVYTGAMSIVWNFSSSFWAGTLFLPVFTVVCYGSDGGPCCHKTHCVAWNVFFSSIVSSKTSMLSNDESVIRPGVYGDRPIPVGIYM